MAKMNLLMRFAARSSLSRFRFSTSRLRISITIMLVLVACWCIICALKRLHDEQQNAAKIYLCLRNQTK